jgi:hypothetical protein
MKPWALALAVLSLTGIAHAQADGPVTSRGCLSLTDRGSVTVKGRLFVKTFPGPPGFESVAHGDAPERTYLLRLPRPICVDDGNEGFADPEVKFDTVHVSVNHPQLWPQLHSGLGQVVVITGEGFAAFDGHHHAPLVILADSVRIASAH